MPLFVKQHAPLLYRCGWDSCFTCVSNLLSWVDENRSQWCLKWLNVFISNSIFIAFQFGSMYFCWNILKLIRILVVVRGVSRVGGQGERGNWPDLALENVWNPKHYLHILKKQFNEFNKAVERSYQVFCVHTQYCQCGVRWFYLSILSLESKIERYSRQKLGYEIWEIWENWKTSSLQMNSSFEEII